MPKSAHALHHRPRLRYMTQPNPEGTPGVVPPVTPPVPAPRTFTQDEITAIAAREKEQGKVAALREASELLGGMSIADAAELVKAARAADEANKTQAQRDLEAAQATKAAAETDRAAAAADRHAARLERLLGTAGASDVEIAAGALKVDVGADDTTITAAITALKTRVPGLFGTPATVPPSDPGKPPAPGGATPNAWDAGKAEAEKRFGKPS